MFRIFQTYRGVSRVRFARFEQRWHEGQIFQRASGIRCLHDAGKNRVSSKSRSGSSDDSSNPMSIHARTKSNLTNRKLLGEDRILATITEHQTCSKHSFETLIFKYVYLDPMMNMKGKRWEQRIGISYFKYWEENWKENSLMRIGCIVFIAEASKQEMTSVKMKMGNWAIFGRKHSDEIIMHSGLMNYGMILNKGNNSSTPWVGHEINTQFQKLDYWHKKRNIKKGDKLFLHNFWFCFNNDAIKTEAVTDIKKSRKMNHQIHWCPEQTRSSEFTCPQRKNEFWQTESITYQSVLEECAVKVYNKNGDENCSQDNLRLERIRSNTPTYITSSELRRFARASGNQQ